MLVLSRFEGETIVIDGGRITVHVVELRRRTGEAPCVRLGVDAPPEIRIDRGEIHELRKAKGEAK